MKFPNIEEVQHLLEKTITKRINWKVRHDHKYKMAYVPENYTNRQIEVVRYGFHNGNVMIIDTLPPKTQYPTFAFMINGCNIIDDNHSHDIYNRLIFLVQMIQDNIFKTTN